MAGRGSFDSLWRELGQWQMIHRSAEVDEFGYDPKFAEWMAPRLRFLYERYFRVELDDVARVPAEGRALLVANHSGALPLDALMVMIGLTERHPARRLVRPLLDDYVYHLPFLGNTLTRLGAVRANRANAERLLAQERLVLVFPEGTKGVRKSFRRRYQLQRFGRGGFVRLALQARAPVIPVAIVGAEEAYPLLSRLSLFPRSSGLDFLPVTPTFPALGPLGLLPLPSKWRIAFGEPLHLHDEVGDAERYDRNVIAQLSERVRDMVQGMVTRLVDERGAPYFG